MKKREKTFQNFLNEVKETIPNTKEIFEKRKRFFYKTVVRFALGFIFLLALLFPTFGLITNVNVFDLPLGWLWFIIYLVTPFLLVFFAFNNHEKSANRLFKFQTILAIGLVAFQFLSYILVVIDPNLFTPNIKFGFILGLLTAVGLAMILWKESALMDPIYSILKLDNTELSKLKESKNESEEKKENELNKDLDTSKVE